MLKYVFTMVTSEDPPERKLLTIYAKNYDVATQRLKMMVGEDYNKYTMVFEHEVNE